MLKLFAFNLYHETIFDINLQALFDAGIRLILTDLDNTLVGSDAKAPTEAVIDWFEKVKTMGFTIKIVSNNFNPERVRTFAQNLGIEAYDNAKKPLKFKILKWLRPFKREEVVFIGDQLLTDIVVGNRLRVYTILVKPINLSADEDITKINRRIERRIAKRLYARGLPVPPHINID